MFGTYAADFNAIEYGQRVRSYLPLLEAKGVEAVRVVLNADPPSCEALAKMLDLPSSVELLSDPSGAAGRAFGVGTGFRPDDSDMSPYLKLFAMLLGLGAPLTLPYVIAGYIGNPFGSSQWIVDALSVGQQQGRWPGNVLELNGVTGEVEANKFAELPVVGSWGRRPLELATLRLQNMVGISIAHWSELAPDLDRHPQVLTQLGGCLVLDADGSVKFEWRDPGICAVAPFEEILRSL